MFEREGTVFEVRIVLRREEIMAAIRCLEAERLSDLNELVQKAVREKLQKYIKVEVEVEVE